MSNPTLPPLPPSWDVVQELVTLRAFVVELTQRVARLEQPPAKPPKPDSPKRPE
jgi:hypothetical protein